MASATHTDDNAPWFGCTGLGEDAERHLLEYIRLEENQSLADDRCTTAHDLNYVGTVTGGDVVVHYWQFRDIFHQLSYASISVTQEDLFYDYGSWTPLHDSYDYR